MRIKGSLFVRMFATALAAMLAVVMVFTLVLARGMHESAQESYEREITMQARETASLLGYISRVMYIKSDSLLAYMLSEKIEYINSVYQADIWLVSYDRGSVQVQYLDNNLRTSFAAADEKLREQLDIIADGNEIRVVGMFPELGDGIVTIGVPWRYQNSRVVGAVLLHISVDSLKVDYAGLVGKVVPFILISIVLSCVVSLFVAHSTTEPIRQIASAMNEFAGGNYEKRASVKGAGEVRQLADTFNRMADEISQTESSRRSFVAAVSHELRSPLTCMRGYVQGILDGTIEGDDIKKYLGVVMDESVRLTDLVRDLLDLSRLESGSFPMDRASFDICELVRRTVITFEKRIEDRQMEVELAIPENGLRVDGDIKRISQVLSNLVDNAIKYGGNELSISVTDEKERARISVHDNGEGISEEDLPKIFEKFYKADKAHTSGKGTGLGLAISKRIMEQHGTLLTCTSTPQSGTTFTFTLPYA